MIRYVIRTHGLWPFVPLILVGMVCMSACTSSPSKEGPVALLGTVANKLGQVKSARLVTTVMEKTTMGKSAPSTVTLTASGVVAGSEHQLQLQLSRDAGASLQFEEIGFQGEEYIQVPGEPAVVLATGSIPAQASALLAPQHLDLTALLTLAQQFQLTDHGEQTMQGVQLHHITAVLNTATVKKLLSQAVKNQKTLQPLVAALTQASATVDLYIDDQTSLVHQLQFQGTVQFDWGEYKYEQEGMPHKFYGFTAILSYSRMRFVTFVKRCDAQTLIRCLMEAFEYFGGLPKAALTDRMKSVLLDMEDKKPRWNALFADFMASIGVAPRVCRAYTPQTKGKVERSVGFFKHSYWAGVTFTDLDDLNRQAHVWCEHANERVHRTTHERPKDRREQEPLTPLPAAFAWERFATEERKVSWDGYLSYDGVLYGLPSSPPTAGSVVQVREWHGLLKVWHAGHLLVELVKRPQSQTHVEHPEQWRGVPAAASRRAQAVPIGHLRPAPQVVARALAEYDQFCGLEVAACNPS